MTVSRHTLYIYTKTIFKLLGQRLTNGLWGPL